MPFHFANVVFFSLTAIGFVLVSLVGGKFLRPNAPTAEKEMIYECGEKPIGRAWYNFNPRFYLVALVFVIFEVEIAFMYPVAAVFRERVGMGWGVFVYGELLVFLAILLIGYVYAYKKGALRWE